MKKIYTIVLIIILNIAFGQQNCIKETPTIDGTPAPCCNANINTDYNYPKNSERLDLLNQFNWLQQNSSGTAPQAFININRNNAIVPIQHPFLNDRSEYWWFSNYKIGQQPSFDNHNMHPKLGWQLLHYNLGLNLFSNTSLITMPQVFNPYMIFYNKYTGKMRMFVSPGSGLSFDSTSVVITHVNSTTSSSSAIFSHNEDYISALDRPTEINAITSSIPFATPNSWVGTDIQTSYDPCLCKNDSRLRFNFVNQDFSRVYMSGNIVGVNKALDNSGNSSLIFNNNFLSSVYSSYIGSKVKPTSGMLVYNEIGNLVNSAYVSPNMKTLSSALNTIKNIVPGIKLAGLPLGDVIKFGLSFGSKQLNPPTPNITFLVAQGAFNGEINNTSNSGSYATFEILNPGSNHEYRQQVPWQQQPFYNEALGLFALLETPKLYYTDIHRDNPIHDLDNGAGGLGIALEKPLLFTLNPAADIDIENSKFYASIEFDLYDSHGQNMYVNNSQNIPVELKDYFAPLFNQLSTDSETEVYYNSNTLEYENGPSNKRVFSSYILPISKIHEFSYWLKFNGGTFFRFICGSTQNNPNFRLRVFADYVFKANEYGIINKTSQTYLFKLNTVCQNDSYYNPYLFPCNNSNNIFCLKLNLNDRLPKEKNITLNTTHYTSNTTLYVDNLKIVGNISTNSNVKVIIYYTGSVEINPSSTISPNVEILFNNINEYKEIVLPTESYMKNVYCKNNYKANLKKSAIVYEEQNDFKYKNLIYLQSLSLHPNPASSIAKLMLTNYHNSNANIKIFDLMGREMLEVIEKDITSREHSVDLDIERLAPGTYIVKVNNGLDEKTTKLVVVRY
jgi:hypothetical protein